MTAQSFTIALFIMVSAHVGSSGTTGDAPIARVGTRVIRYREIACELNAPNFRELAAKLKRDPETLCREREQQRLELLVSTELVDAAMRKTNVAPTPEEMAKDAEFHHYGEAEFARLSERYRGLARAALLIFHGEDFSAVYVQKVKSAGFSEKDFRRFVDGLGNAAAAERFITLHTPEHFRTSILTDARRRLARARLMQVLQDEAAKRGVSFEAQAETFWRALAAEIGLEVLNQRHQPISLKELSWKPSTSNTP